jgi:branched-chain amino acid transport system permease protein
MKKHLGWLRTNIWQASLAVIFAILCLFLIRERYVALILCNIGIFAIAVTGLDILFGYTGQISFGHAGFFAIGAYGSTLLSMRLGLPPALTVPLASGLAAVFGIIIAFPAAKLVRHFLSVFTIAFGQMVYMFVKATNALTGGSGGITLIPNISILGFEFNTNQRSFFLIWTVLILVLVGKKRLIDSRIGRAFIAIKENTPAADGLGINVRNYKILAFAISAMLTGLAGAFYAHLINYISPDTFMPAQSTMFMTMLLFGGLGTLTGPLVGASTLLIIKQIMQSFIHYQNLIYAIFILIVLFLMPKGVVGGYDGLIDKLRRQRSKVSRTAGKEVEGGA